MPIARPKARGGSSKSEVLIYSIHYPKVTEADLILAMSRKFATNIQLWFIEVITAKICNFKKYGRFMASYKEEHNSEI